MGKCLSKSSSKHLQSEIIRLYELIEDSQWIVVVNAAQEELVLGHPEEAIDVQSLNLVSSMQQSAIELTKSLTDDEMSGEETNMYPGVYRLTGDGYIFTSIPVAGDYILIIYEKISEKSSIVYYEDDEELLKIGRQVASMMG
eukprot:TRINITY_DN3078_c0_g1_i6.p1 TRINITY_DN3078_c0_g1~~TRINITY_DN3078_c0_g1_i6.p1  ORF type:complete len:142 (+),score=36.61 TRINITY_DN3078_c0_g1_i6:27-452(+)